MPIRDLGVPFLRRFRPPTLHRLQREQKIRPLQKRLHAEVRGSQVCAQLTKFETLVVSDLLFLSESFFILCFPSSFLWGREADSKG